MKAATALARALLWLYPPSFRAEMGEALLGDVRRRASEIQQQRGQLRVSLWLVRLGASLVLNAVGAWWETTRFFSWLDLKLALRMLVKYPGLTLVGGLGIAVAVAIGVGFFAVFHSRFYPDIPLPDGDRLVGLENRDRRTHDVERRLMEDLAVWRAEMTSVEDLTAFRTVTRNAITEDGAVDVVQVAEITPSGFQLARVPPLVGRMLVDSDAAADAAPALIIGFDVWRARFGSDPGIIGRVVRLGGTAYTIAGVMPEGFAFPVNHQYWIPLRNPGQNAQVFVAGRLAPGFDLARANAEITAIGQRMASRLPDTHQHLRPEVLPYTYPFAGMAGGSADAFWPVTVLISLVLVVVCVNVAILIYARTATRLGEIVVRTALGASRGRIVFQLFAESFVVSTVAAGIGILLVKSALDWARAGMTQLAQSHFWPEYQLSGSAVIYGVVLAVLAAVITGVIPALRATSRRTALDLRDLKSTAGLRLGRTWTTLIVVQVSVASAALPIAIGLGWFQVRDIFNLPRFPVDQILFADVSLDREREAGQDGASYWSRLGADFANRQDELARRLNTEPGVTRQAFTTNLPNIGRSGAIAIEHDPAGLTRSIQPAGVGIDFFRTFDVDLLAGRTFSAADYGEQAAGVVVVNRAFVTRLLGGDSALGRRIRFPPNGPWLDIVGVVENIDANPFGDDLVQARVYQPLKGDRGSARLAVRMAASDRGALARKLPAIAAALDPALHLRLTPLEDMYRLQRLGLTVAALGIGVSLLSVILLSAAGIYALMSFTVTRRRREIAIRTALGAQPHRLLGGIFSQALRQISVGVVIGLGVALLIDYSQEGEALGGHRGVVLPVMVIVMAGVGMLAALGPARRGLRIQPVESLKSE